MRTPEPLAPDGVVMRRKRFSVGGHATERPASFAEARLWRGERARPDTSAFVECPRHVPFVSRVVGPLNLPRMARAMTTVLAASPVWRSRFAASETDADIPLRRLAACTDALPVIIDLSGTRRTVREERLAEWLARHVNDPFDLTAGPLVRAGVIRLGTNDHVVALVAHHIVCDGWSKFVIGRDLADAYEGAPREPTPVSAEYTKYVDQQRAFIGSPAGRRSVEYWRAQLAGMSETPLPNDCGGPPTSTRSGIARFTIPNATAAAVRELARANGVTPGVAMTGIFMALLSKITGAEDIAVGLPAADRNRPEFERIVGLFMNLVVVRTLVSPTLEAGTLLQRMRRTFVGAYEHAQVPYGYLRAALAADGRQPDVRVVFNFMTSRRPALSLPDCRVEPVELDVDTPSCADVSVHLIDRHESMGGFVLFKADRFSADCARAFASSFETMMREVASHPGRALRDHAVAGC